MKKRVSLHALLEKGCFTAVVASFSVQNVVNSDKYHLRMLKNIVNSDKNELNMRKNGRGDLNFKWCLARFVFFAVFYEKAILHLVSCFRVVGRKISS